MAENIKYKSQGLNISNLKSQISNSHTAFLWDESFLWGLMAHKALTGLGLQFDLVTSQDIQSGVLNKYDMLFVPGGWASNKSKALGETGIEAVQAFVSNGGSYLGFCGGAGLAIKAMGGLGLLNIKRRPTKERVPSFSGRIELNTVSHPIWDGLSGSRKNTTPELRTPNSKLVFHAWWPSQFIVEDDDIEVLASYGRALPDSFSSDLNVGDVEDHGSWEELEKVYQINLDPQRLINEPSVVEGTYGKGKVVLSLVHFDTPDDINGRQVMTNLWGYLGNGRMQRTDNRVSNSHSSELSKLCVDELISLGERNFLWYWRNPILLQWRRGVRGLEYNTLYAMINEIMYLSEEHSTRDRDKQLSCIEGLLVPFVEKAKRLLVLERHALQKGHITYRKCDDSEIKAIRNELFSGSKSYGGAFKSLIDEMDSLLLSLLKEQSNYK